MATTKNAAQDMARLGRLHMARMADEDEDPNLREGIKYPGKHDVMLGRGGESTYHCGNIAFRQLVEDHKTIYYTAPRAHKSRVVAEVVKKWRQLTPPGRFLTRTNPTMGDKSPWHDVGDSRALKKASHSLRDAVRCFSAEKKQRAEELEGSEGKISSLPVAQPVAKPAAQPDVLKRNRFLKPEFILSASRVGSHRLARPKSKKLIGLPGLEERPNKRQRVVSDEAIKENCREKHPKERGTGRDGGDAPNCAGSLLDHAKRFLLSPRDSMAQRHQTRQKNNMSPCGSADWFTIGTEDLPIQAASSVTLPTADVLVQEVVVSDSVTHNNGGESVDASDDDSLGWFSDNEPDIAAFTSAPLFNVDLYHQPLASLSGGQQ